MAELVANCPRCSAARVTFDCYSSTYVGLNYGWMCVHELFGVCRHCHRSTVFVVKDRKPQANDRYGKNGPQAYEGVVNDVVEVAGFVSIADMGTREPPEHLPPNIEKAFSEGAKARAVGCYNAAATMFRLCLDLATRTLLPVEHIVGLNHRTRRDLGPRLGWLFDTGRLPEAFRELSTCIRDDGNDGAHAGTLSADDASDIEDFAFILLERLYTEPERLRLAAERRNARRIGQ